MIKWLWRSNSIWCHGSVNMGLGNALLVDGTKAFTWANVNISNGISQQVLKSSVSNIVIKIVYKLLLPNLPRGKET